MVFRSGVHSAPVAISMPSGPGPASRTAPAPEQVEAVKQQISGAMDQAERKAAAAMTPSAAINAVKDAQRALDSARRMRGPAPDRTSLVRDLERRLEQCKLAADKAIGAMALGEQDAERRRREYASVPDGGGRLSPDQLGVRDKRAIRNYTREKYYDPDSYKAINSALSGKTPGGQKVTVDTLADRARGISELSAALAKLPAHQGSVLRGAATPLAPDEIDRYEPGEVIVEPRFLSATVDPEREFSRYGGNVIWVIESKTGRSIADYAEDAVAYEKEVLFDKFARFEVFAKEYNDEMQAWVIYMEEV
jgi:hypothetical protein